MKQLLKSNGILILVGSLLYLGVTFGMIMSSIEVIKGSQKEHTVESPIDPVLDGPSWTYLNPKLNELILELRIRLEEVKKKEDELKLWEQQIEKESLYIRNITNRVEDIKTQVNKVARKISTDEDANLKKLLELFKSLETSQTATILEPMSDEKISRIFSLLKPADVGPIVDLWLKQGGAMKDRVLRILDTYQDAVPEVGTVLPQ